MRRWIAVAVTLLVGANAFAFSPGERAPLRATARAVTSAAVPPLRLVPIVTSGLQEPLYLTHAGDGSGLLFVVEQPGRIRVIERGGLLKTPFLDLSERVLSGGERGLLGVAFHPDYARNGRYIVNYTRRPDGATVVAEYRRSDRPTRSRTEERVLLIVPQPYPNHNGGMVAFGPDGLLYIGLGDGGSAGDPQNRSQNRDELLGKILRIDVDRGTPYAIPPDNPFVAGGGRPEIFAYGLRNPWRFSFDRRTGMLWAADVGQYEWEEVDMIQRGGNYGWRIMEGAHCYSPPRGCQTAGLIFPVAEYGHERGRCSITGGYVYRGRAVPALQGLYLYGDYCSGELFALDATAPASGEARVLLQTGLSISSFGEDEQGELYVVDHRGGVYRLAAEPQRTGG
ncbi:MAG TPA: PQQ-dependent sugar dehydrogenase [Nitrospiraceae bacterium]|jgi:glucose/arabinose dehydrogenase|nr:PQQ-dependent sugar dehydrogenase [Nitrospiraceae bacterium]